MSEVETCIHGVPYHQYCRECPPVPCLDAAARALLAYVEEVTKGSYREWHGTEWTWPWLTLPPSRPETGIVARARYT